MKDIIATIVVGLLTTAAFIIISSLAEASLLCNGKPVYLQMRNGC